MFHAPKGSYTIFNYLTKFTQNKYTRPYIILHVVPTFFASALLYPSSYLPALFF